MLPPSEVGCCHPRTLPPSFFLSFFHGGEFRVGYCHPRMLPPSFFLSFAVAISKSDVATSELGTRMSPPSDLPSEVGCRHPLICLATSELGCRHPLICLPTSELGTREPRRRFGRPRNNVLYIFIKYFFFVCSIWLPLFSIFL
jgi:hypothetical protein